MTISPLEPSDVKSIVAEALKDYNQAVVTQPAIGSAPRQIGKTHMAELQQLCWFMSFYICEKLSKNVEGEIDSLVGAIRFAEELPSIRDLDKQLLRETLVGLRQLKSGGILPGHRLCGRELQRLVTANAKVFCRQAPHDIFNIESWTPDFAEIHISNGTIEGRFGLHDLIFIDPDWKNEAEKGEPPVLQAEG